MAPPRPCHACKGAKQLVEGIQIGVWLDREPLESGSGFDHIGIFQRLPS